MDKLTEEQKQQILTDREMQYDVNIKNYPLDWSHTLITQIDHNMDYNSSTDNDIVCVPTVLVNESTLGGSYSFKWEYNVHSCRNVSRFIVVLDGKIITDHKLESHPK